MANNIDSSVPECATHRKCSLAQDDIVKYRRAFDSADRERRGKVRSGDLEDVVQKLGYRLTPVQMQVRRGSRVEAEGGGCGCRLTIAL